ncbi:unnamed protein product, partial [Rotaria socialis]
NVVSLQPRNRVKRQLSQLSKTKHSKFQAIFDANNTNQTSTQSDVI